MGETAVIYTCSTAEISGQRSRTIRSMPSLRVVFDIGQPPQAPINCTYATASETRTSHTSPPSR